MKLRILKESNKKSTRLNKKRQSQISQQTPKVKEEPWFQKMTQQADGSLAATRVVDVVDGSIMTIVYADPSGNPPVRAEDTIDGPQYIYGNESSTVVGKMECKSKYNGDLPENSQYSMICYVRHPG